MRFSESGTDLIGQLQVTSLIYSTMKNNPHIPENIELAVAFQQEAELLLERSIRSFRKEQLLTEIDLALDRQDEKSFKLLVEQLQQLEKDK